eukprot:365512-Chlamydomonas_euryale.AAC.3
MCNKAPKRTPELQGSGFKALMTSTPRAGVSPKRWGRKGGRGCARLRQVTPGFRQLRHLVTPCASYATPLDELQPQTWSRGVWCGEGGRCVYGRAEGPGVERGEVCVCGIAEGPGVEKVRISRLACMFWLWPHFVVWGNVL